MCMRVSGLLRRTYIEAMVCGADAMVGQPASQSALDHDENNRSYSPRVGARHQWLDVLSFPRLSSCGASVRRRGTFSEVQAAHGHSSPLPLLLRNRLKAKDARVTGSLAQPLPSPRGRRNQKRREVTTRRRPAVLRWMRESLAPIRIASAHASLPAPVPPRIALSSPLGGWLFAEPVPRRLSLPAHAPDPPFLAFERAGGPWHRIDPWGMGDSVCACG